MTLPNCSFDLSCGRVAVFFEPGTRLTVLLIHGNSASMAIFAPQVARLCQEGFGVLALDLPGHGASENARDPAGTYSFPGYAGVVAEVLDAVAVERVHVVGWSLGGHVGLELMGRDARVASLLICGTPPAKPSMSAFLAAFHQTPSMDFARKPTLTSEECERYAEAMVGGGVGPTDTVARSIQRTDGQARAWMFENSLNGIGLDARDLVEKDPRPLAVVHGAADPFIRADYLEMPAYFNLWQNKVQVLPGVGHAANWQAPDLFNAILLPFLLSFPEKLSL